MCCLAGQPHMLWRSPATAVVKTEPYVATARDFLARICGWPWLVENDCGITSFSEVIYFPIFLPTIFCSRLLIWLLIYRHSIRGWCRARKDSSTVCKIRFNHLFTCRYKHSTNSRACCANFCHTRWFACFSFCLGLFLVRDMETQIYELARHRISKQYLDICFTVCRLQNLSWGVCRGHYSGCCLLGIFHEEARVDGWVHIPLYPAANTISHTYNATSVILKASLLRVMHLKGNHMGCSQHICCCMYKGRL